MAVRSEQMLECGHVLRGYVEQDPAKLGVSSPEPAPSPGPALALTGVSAIHKEFITGHAQCQFHASSLVLKLTIYMKLWPATRDFWLRSYHSDRTAFWYETVSALCIFTATTTLALTADQPNMTLIYPINFVGAIFSTLSFLRRGAGWPLVMTVYFMHLHIFGFGRSLAWW